MFFPSPDSALGKMGGWPCQRAHRRGATLKRAHGAAAVEFVVVAPVLLTLVFGCIDLGRSIMVLDLLTNAARAGCRVGILPSNGNSDIDTAVSNALASGGITTAPDPTIDVMPQGKTKWTSPGDAGSATTGDAIRVTVSVPYTQTNWLAFNWFMPASANLSSAVVMSKE
jgi:Flp pilus assembly protein TadG